MKPCPFCGKQPVPCKEIQYGMGYGKFSTNEIRCECGATMVASTEEKANEAWEKRA
jgi:hypothetical protein